MVQKKPLEANDLENVSGGELLERKTQEVYAAKIVVGYCKYCKKNQPMYKASNGLVCKKCKKMN